MNILKISCFCAVIQCNMALMRDSRTIKLLFQQVYLYLTCMYLYLYLQFEITAVFVFAVVKINVFVFVFATSSLYLSQLCSGQF